TLGRDRRQFVAVDRIDKPRLHALPAHPAAVEIAFQIFGGRTHGLTPRLWLNLERIPSAVVPARGAQKFASRIFGDPDSGDPVLTEKPVITGSRLSPACAGSAGTTLIFYRRRVAPAWSAYGCSRPCWPSIPRHARFPASTDCSRDCARRFPPATET